MLSEDERFEFIANWINENAKLNSGFMDWIQSFDISEEHFDVAINPYSYNEYIMQFNMNIYDVGYETCCDVTNIFIDFIAFDLSDEELCNITFENYYNLLLRSIVCSYS